MGKIKGWTSSKFKFEKDKAWYSNNNTKISIGDGVTGVYHVFYNPSINTAPSKNHTLKVFKTKSQATKFAINYMKSHPNG